MLMQSGSTNDIIEFCLKEVRQPRPKWNTVVPVGVARTELSADGLWEVLGDVEAWPDWSPLHRAVAWQQGSALTVGARFEQQLDLGFPVGRTTEQVTLALAEPGRRAGWTGDKGGVRSCHVWAFTPTPDGGTEVSNVEALTGFPIALVHPFVARRWQRQFQAAAEGLVAAAEGHR